jgi:TldD protein
MVLAESWFARRLGLTPGGLEAWLSEALSRGGDYADLYFECVERTALSLEDSLVKTASQSVSIGVGVRVLAGERTGYAYTSDLSPEKIREAARTAACIAAGPARVLEAGLAEAPRHALYELAPEPASLTARLALIRRADEAARAADARVFQVVAGLVDAVSHILVATSDGRLAADDQPMARLSVAALARNAGGAPQRGMSGGGGRAGLDMFTGDRSPEAFAREAVRQALVQLEAAPAPAGEMTVVLGPGWPGILLHEAVGHGLEADFNRKQVSAFANRLNEPVASPLVTVVDDGTLAGRRGSLNVDDEGEQTRRTVLIENGTLRGYLQDRLSSRLLGAAPTGNGRRESYRHAPMPRMTNTFMLAGESDPADIIRSVPRGIYCAHFGGGQVDITSGNFVFSATESYLIEDGRLTRPLRGASLIGNGPEALKHVSMVGHDLELDQGVGICGKEGQSVPVGVGIPTLKLDRMTVGGSA